MWDQLSLNDLVDEISNLSKLNKDDVLRIAKENNNLLGTSVKNILYNALYYQYRQLGYDVSKINECLDATDMSACMKISIKAMHNESHSISSSDILDLMLESYR